MCLIKFRSWKPVVKICYGTIEFRAIFDVLLRFQEASSLFHSTLLWERNITAAAGRSVPSLQRGTAGPGQKGAWRQASLHRAECIPCCGVGSTPHRWPVKSSCPQPAQLMSVSQWRPLYCATVLWLLSVSCCKQTVRPRRSRFGKCWAGTAGQHVHSHRIMWPRREP